LIKLLGMVHMAEKCSNYWRNY